MNTIKQLEEALLPVLEMTQIKPDDYLIVSGAAEFLAGLSTRFGDVDVIINNETFRRLKREMYCYSTRDFAGKQCRVIRIGHVDLIEHTGDWFNVPRNSFIQYPIMDDEHLVKWRIEIGRPKDQLRAWQMIHQLDPNYPVQVDLIPRRTEYAGDRSETLKNFTSQLMELV